MTTLSYHTSRQEEILVFHIAGRLDAHWADQLSDVLERSLLEGENRLSLDLGETSYISSAGIRLLVRMMKKIREVRGVFFISRASSEVTSILSMVGMAHLIGAPAEMIPEETERPESETPVDQPSFRGTRKRLPVGNVLVIRTVGDPTQLFRNGEGLPAPEVVNFTRGMYGLGYGSIGRQAEDFRQHAGEFAAFGPELVFKPADGRGKPDYLTGQPSPWAPMTVGYGLVAEGDFPFCLSFQSADPAGTVPLSDLAGYCAGAAGNAPAAMVFIAELEYITGVSLTLPVSEPGAFEVERVREHFYVSVEPDYPKHLVVGFGIADAAGHAFLAPFLRAWSADGLLRGHFHAVVLPRKPLRRDETSLKEMISHVFFDHPVSDIYHLLYDDRTDDPVKMTCFTRGLVWFGPLHTESKTGKP